MSKRKALFAIGTTIGGAFIFAAASQITNRFFENRQTKRYKSKSDAQNTSKITFSDVAGYSHVLKSFNEIIKYFKDPESFRRVGASPQRGILLYGPPGTGKTYMARALAGELKASFFYASGSEMIEQFVGVGAARIRNLFQQASKEAPSIIFIDEIDAIGAKRSSDTWHREHDQTLAELLISLDGFEQANQLVILIAATNRLEVLDEALTRPGRFNRKIFLGLPDNETRREVLIKASKKQTLSQDMDFSVIAESTEGWSGADLKNLLDQAATLAAVEESDVVTYSHIRDAFEILHGEKNANDHDQPGQIKHSIAGRSSKNYDYWQEVKRLFDEASAEIDPIRRETLKRQISEFDKWFEANSDEACSFSESDKRAHELREFANQLRRAASGDPLLSLREKGSTVSKNSREEKVLLLLTEMKYLLIDYQEKGSYTSTHQQEDKNGLLSLSMKCSELITEMSKYGDNPEGFRQIESERARPLALQVRKLVREHHVMIATPVWSTSHRPPFVEPGSLFFSGDRVTENQLSIISKKLGLRLSCRGKPGRDFAEYRWTELQNSDLAIFDISGCDPQVYYELGVALSIGREILVLASEGTTVPFDINFGIHTYSAPQIDIDSLEQLIDSTIYGVQSVSQQLEARSTTVNRLQSILQSSDDFLHSVLNFALESIVKNVDKDSFHGFTAKVSSFLAWLPFSSEQLIYPRWPAAYPQEDALKRCFIVMPFKKSFSSASETFASVLQGLNIKPVRGDSLGTADNIIEAIWEELCIADYVLVDITDFNPNVSLEMGIAHTLGKPVLMVGAKGTERIIASSLPNVAHMRCYIYENPSTFKDELRQIVEAFVVDR